MTYVIPQALADAVSSLENLGTQIESANIAGLPNTTGILPAAADEVSAAITSLFNAHGGGYQQLAAHAQVFHQQFTQRLAASAASYVGTEVVNAEQVLWNKVGQLEQPFLPLITQLESNFTYVSPPLVAPPLPSVTNSTVALLMGGTNFPVLPTHYVNQIMSAYITPNFDGAMGTAIYTPEQLWPLTPALGNLTLGQSIAQGVPLLNAAINTELGQGNKVVVWGTSQSSTVLTNEIRNLIAAGSPNTNQLSFILTGDPNNPNGGPFERFPGLYVPGLDVLFNGATPPNSPYPTMIFTNQYDGVANFPQYPLNVVSDVNAIAGFLYGAHDYADFTPSQMANYIQLPTSPAYTGKTLYYEMLSQNLPLVTPLRIYGTPPYGNALADLLQPDLRVLVDMGYGSGEYANIPTPASLFELPNPFTIGPDLVHGTIQGAEASLVDLGLLPTSYYPMGQYPFSPVLNLDLNFPLPQSSNTGVSLLTGFEGQLMQSLGLVPPWDQ